jgi:hypothetical protein
LFSSLFFCCYLLVCYIIVGFFIFIFIPIFFFYFLYYQFYHHCLLILTLTTFTLPPFLMLKSIALQHNYSFCPFSSTLYSCLIFPSPPPTCQLTTPPSYILTTYYTNFTQAQPPAIPDTNTLHYSNKHMQGPQAPAASTPLPPLPHPTFPFPF